MTVQFEWDPVKARKNHQRHGVSFEEAVHVFEDPYAMFELDRIDETGDPRWHVLGRSGGTAILLVVHTIRETSGREIIRLISARPAIRRERTQYEEISD